MSERKYLSELNLKFIYIRTELLSQEFSKICE